MDNFNFYSPTEFVFGANRENEARQMVRKFGGKRVLVHFGGGSVIRSGLMDRVKASLDAAGIAYVELGGVMPNPRSGLVYKGIELCRKEKVDFVLAAPSTLPRPLLPVPFTKATSGITTRERSSITPCPSARC